MDKKYLKKFAELFLFHKIISSEDELTEVNFEDMVVAFQEKNELLNDGIPGQETLWSLQYPWVKQGQKLLFERCEADMVPGINGFDSLLLRSDAANLYRKLHNEVKEKGAVITTAGGKRSLNVGVNASRSATSMHYPGLAFDLAVTSGFFNPETDPFIITKNDSDRYWTVWARALRGEDNILEAIYWENWNSGKDLKKSVHDKFLNFTSLCKNCGFYPIKPRYAFTRLINRKYLSSEWWHFQADSLLISNISQLGIELLRIEDYDPDFIKLKNENVWSNRKARYGKEWN